MMMLSRFALPAALLAYANGSFALDDPTASLSYNEKNPLKLDKLPDTGEQWSTLKNGVQMQPAANLSPLAQEHLRRLTTNTDDWQTNPYEKLFVDGAETQYDEYAQAWRALGFYIDCDYCDPERGCWWDQNNQYNNNYNNGGNNNGQASGCQRFMLWAAYVDEHYSGNGAGEYQYWNRKNNRWDSSACSYSASTRCARMDCHLSNTHFSLLGFFKEPHYDDWMEQLFKHEGDCVWTDDEYQFMQENREAWPNGCTQTMFMAGTEGGSSTPIYYDVKPMPYGEFGIGLYLDSACINEYAGDLSVAIVVSKMKEFYNNGNDDGGEDQHDDDNENWVTLAEELDLWNSAFEVFKQCQPCKAYDLTNIVAGRGYKANKNGNRYSNNGNFYYGNGNNGGNYNQNYNNNGANNYYYYRGNYQNYNNNVNYADGYCQDAGGNVRRCNGNDDTYAYGGGGYRQLPENNRNLRNYYVNNNYNGQGGNNNKDNNNGNDESFHCYDDAGYDNVNQCMKFATKTTMMTATWTDLEMAGAQGTISLIQLGGALNNSWAYGRGERTIGAAVGAKAAEARQFWAALNTFFLSSIAFCAAAVYYWHMTKAHRDQSEVFESMVEKSQSVGSFRPRRVNLVSKGVCA